jgi:hypothetical protein
LNGTQSLRYYILDLYLTQQSESETLNRSVALEVIV